MNSRNRIITILAVLVVAFVIVPAYFIITEGHIEQSQFRNTALALAPAVIAIVLALATREVYLSLFLGILVGAVYYGGFAFDFSVEKLIGGGFVSSLDSYNVGILMFLVLLGTMVAMMSKTGGSAAFARWAETHVKSKTGIQLTGILLGILVFVDDYFNCLTVGSVMRPLTDRHKVSRAKLAYIIDSTAAPICIIAPISSWAAAVSGFVPGSDGFTVFLSTIPYNYYAILTIIGLIMFTVLKLNIGPMARFERDAEEGKPQPPYEGSDDLDVKDNPDARVLDLILPVIVLIASCLIAMLFSGGFFKGTSFIDAISGCDASLSLAGGSLFAIMITMIYYCSRKLFSLEECMKCVPEGFKAMVPAILILVFAWTLKTMTTDLGSAEFIKSILENSGNLVNFLPIAFFIIGLLIAFATGTSWGTFGILIPIVVAALNGVDNELMIISISASMAGSVCGDHCSPVSDTTIMSSAGSRCSLMDHVITQAPYVAIIGTVSAVCFLLAGFIKNPVICLPIAIVLLIATIMIINRLSKKPYTDS